MENISNWDQYRHGFLCILQRLICRSPFLQQSFWLFGKTGEKEKRTESVRLTVPDCLTLASLQTELFPHMS
jgi:hypothetical protein